MFNLDLIDVGASIERICSGNGTAADLQALIDAGARRIRVNDRQLIVDGFPVTADRESISRLIGRLN